MKYLPLALLFLSSSCFAQELSVNVTYADAITITTPSTTTETAIEGVVIASVTKEGVATQSIQPIALLKIETAATAVRCKSATTAIEKLGAGKFLISTPGKHTVDVLAIGIIDGQLLFEEKTILVELGQGPNPPPTPPEPIDADVSDVYGLGKIAYSTAPIDARGCQQFADWYREAGNFLYGIPILKPISNANNSDSVFAWLTQQMDSYPCPDPETCAAWKQWRLNIAEAFKVSQTKRQFMKSDWFAAFEEIAAALEARQ